MISAIILAAGESSRFGEPKVLYKINNKSFLELILENILKIKDINEIILVLGYNFNEIVKKINKSKNIRIVENKNYKNGQLSSFQTGIKNIRRDNKGIFMILVDYPFVKYETYKKMIDTFKEKNYQNIVIPTYNNKKGHPVIFPFKLIKEILNAPLNEGARYVVNKYKNLIKLIETDDKYILKDIDYKKDLKIVNEE